MEIRECIVNIYDADGVEHSVKVRAESVCEAALKGFQRFDRLSLAKDDGSLIVEVYEEPTVRRIRVEKMFGWLQSSGRNPGKRRLMITMIAGLRHRTNTTHK